MVRKVLALILVVAMMVCGSIAVAEGFDFSTMNADELQQCFLQWLVNLGCRGICACQ